MPLNLWSDVERLRAAAQKVATGLRPGGRDDFANTPIWYRMTAHDTTRGYSCRKTVRLLFPKAPPPTSGAAFLVEVPMLLHRRIAPRWPHLRVARYDGCASDICRAERRLNALLDELPRPIRGARTIVTRPALHPAARRTLRARPATLVHPGDETAGINPFPSRSPCSSPQRCLREWPARSPTTWDADPGPE